MTRRAWARGRRRMDRWTVVEDLEVREWALRRR